MLFWADSLALGDDMREYSFTTPHGIVVTRTVTKAGFRRGLKHLVRDLDLHRGIYLSSGYEYPGRYSRWDIASTRPPLEIVSYDRKVEFRPLSIRGEILNQILLPVVERHPHWESFACVDGALLRSSWQGSWLASSSPPATQPWRNLRTLLSPPA